MTVRVVADSACDVPESVAEALGITIVPVYVNIGEKSYLDGVELTHQEFYDNLTSYPSVPTTAAPATGTFTETYLRLAEEGATEILSLHIASSLSATYNAARLGAEAAEGIPPVTLFDTQQITIGGGLLAIAAAEAAAAGCSVAEIVAMLNERVTRTCLYATLDTLEFLRRSGRVSWAQFGLGTLLQIKPIMKVYQGEVSVVERIRTRKRSLQRLLELMAESAPLERLAILYTSTPDEAEIFRRQAEPYFPEAQRPISMAITPAIGAHVGPGAVGFACIRAGNN